MSENIRARFKKLQEAVATVEGVYVRDIRDFINGNVSVNKKGELKLPLTLPAEDVLPDVKDVSSIVRGQWKMLPLMVFISDDEIEPGKQPG